MKENESVLIFVEGKKALLGKVKLWQPCDDEIQVCLKITQGTSFKEGQKVKLVDVLREYDLIEDNATLVCGNGHKQ